MSQGLRSRGIVLAALCSFFCRQPASAQAALAPAALAQSSSAPPSGPTMQQTVDFINETLRAEGDYPEPGSNRGVGIWQAFRVSENLVSLDGPCSLAAGSDLLTVLHLDKTDPLSVSLLTEKAEDAPTYRLVIERAVFDWKTPAQKTGDAETAVPPYTVFGGGYILQRGIVRSITPTEITYVPAPGKFVTLRINQDVRVLDSSTHPPFSGDTQTSVSAFRIGDLAEAQPALSNKGQREKSGPYTMTRVAKSIRTQSFWGPLFRDRTLAERTAKAYVHAIVLCRRDEKPSLF